MHSCDTSPLDIPFHAIVHFSICTGPVQDYAANDDMQLFQASFNQNAYSMQD